VSALHVGQLVGGDVVVRGDAGSHLAAARTVL
jgi:hypothetical protein